MNPHSPKLIKLIVCCIVIIFNFSCTKDSDLAQAYVDESIGTPTIVDDHFVIYPDKSTILDILANDDFSPQDNVTITKTTLPKNGTITINDDNTVTYTPDSVGETVEEDTTTEVKNTKTAEDNTDTETTEENTDTDATEENTDTETTEENTDSVASDENTETAEESTDTDTADEDTETEEDGTEDDTFTYTTEVEDEDGEITTEEGTVTVTAPEDASRNVNEVNLSTFGAVGDGKTDDTKALQSAIDSGKDLIANADAIFLVSEEVGIGKITALEVDGSGNQSINWNGSTITTNFNNLRFFFVDKPTGTLTMKDLTIQGNGEASRGLQAETPIHLINIDIYDLENDGTYSYNYDYGIGTRVRGNGTNFGDYIIDGCDIYNSTSSNNNNRIGDAKGAVRGYQHIWSGSPPPVDVTITFKNGTIDGVWSEDGDCIVLTQSDFSMESSNSWLVFDNLYVTNFGRRGGKMLGGNVIFQNCTFESTPLKNSDPNYQGTSNLGPAGMIAFSNPSGSTSANTKQSHNQKIKNCVFIGTNSGYNNSWDVITFNNGDLTVVENCTFTNGATLRYGQRMGGGYICNSSFGTKCYLNDVGVQSINGALTIDNNIEFIDSDWNRLDSYKVGDNSLRFADLNCN